MRGHTVGTESGRQPETAHTSRKRSRSPRRKRRDLYPHRRAGHPLADCLICIEEIVEDRPGCRGLRAHLYEADQLCRIDGHTACLLGQQHVSAQKSSVVHLAVIILADERNVLRCVYLLTPEAVEGRETDVLKPTYGRILNVQFQSNGYRLSDHRPRLVDRHAEHNIVSGPWSRTLRGGSRALDHFDISLLGSVRLLAYLHGSRAYPVLSHCCRPQHVGVDAGAGLGGLAVYHLKIGGCGGQRSCQHLEPFEGRCLESGHTGIAGSREDHLEILVRGHHCGHIHRKRVLGGGSHRPQKHTYG